MAGASRQYDVTVLVDSVKEKLQYVNPRRFERQCCIHRVPQWLRKINDDRAYTPEMVSIGPYHHGKEHLSAMEEHKMLYMQESLTRNPNISLSDKLKSCAVSIELIEQEARDCYSETSNLSTDEFVVMMILDGLFIIELFRRKVGEVITNENDPLINNRHIDWSTLVRDLVKLENQLPMLVLNFLFDLSKSHEEQQGSCNITMLALKFFNTMMPRDADVLERYSGFVGKHLLDLVSQTFVGVETEKNSWTFIPSVTELKRTGLKFKKGSTTNTFVDIKYKAGGMLEFPPVTIRKHQTDFLLGNLIAFEECCGGHVNHITSYALLMYRLINSGKDVGVLRNKGIITNYFGSDEDVSHFFMKLACEVNRSNFCYSTLCDQVNLYYESSWRVWRKVTWRKIFNDYINPPAVILMLVIATLTFFMHKS